MLADETIQTVRDRVRIADVVGERVQLKRRGRSLLGLCPFHKEKTPSFNVSEERNFYHCFGCGASGDAIRFVQETEGLSFIEAIRELAQGLNIDIVETTESSAVEQKRGAQARKRRDELYALNEAAAAYFERCLAEHPLRDHAREELARRGLDLSAATVLEALAAFRVGYAPYGWDGLTQSLKGLGHSVQAAESLGLLGARKTGGGHYDRFRHRLMFAVYDLRGRIVGFSGRALAEPPVESLRAAGQTPAQAGADAPAKYINSPESPIYKKREVVFGLYQARNAVRQEDACILVEGNLDVVSLHARELLNVAAPLGTAFTNEQAQQIRRYSANVILLFDGDSAGQRANGAARKPCSEEALNAKVATLPQGKDPDDLAREKGIDAVRACVSQARGMLEYLIESTLDSGFKSADPEAQGRKIQQVVQLLKEEQDPTTRALALAQADTIAARLGISDVRSFHALRRAIASAAAPSGPRRDAAPPEQARSAVSRSAIGEDILGAIAEYPELLQDPPLRALLGHASGQLALDLAAVQRAAPCLSDHIDTLRGPLRALVASRTAAPKHDTKAEAYQTALQNLRKVRREDQKRAKADLVERLRRAISEGDTETEMALLQEQARLATAIDDA